MIYFESLLLISMVLVYCFLCITLLALSSPDRVDTLCRVLTVTTICFTAGGNLLMSAIALAEIGGWRSSTSSCRGMGRPRTVVAHMATRIVLKNPIMKSVVCTVPERKDFIIWISVHERFRTLFLAVIVKWNGSIFCQFFFYGNI